MISSFFLKRPVFASVVAILMLFIGFAALRVLPIEQYPDITPPQIHVMASYRGADAKTVAETVAAPLEQEVNGVENMLYMYSQNSSSGEMSLSVVFEIGSDVNQAQMDVQNRVNVALTKLPLEVQREGVTVKKQIPNILLLVGIQSPDGRYEDVYVSNFASLHVVETLKRLPGVSDVQMIGGRDYSIRIWLHPDRMSQLGITTEDVRREIQAQNAQFALGKIGQAPQQGNVLLTIPVLTQGQFQAPEQFEEVILKADEKGSIVKLKDIADVELGAENYDVIGTLNGKSTALIAVYQQFGANALDVAQSVKNEMEKLSHEFPKGLTFYIPYDTTIYIKTYIQEVFATFYEAAILVALVVFLFLQNFKATLIPVVAMAVSIVATFAGMEVLGFTINTLTLFGLVLAIGMVVDDAIVVIENVERNLKEKKLPAMEAAIVAMEEVTAPVIATTLVLASVFIPVAFLGGIAGELYKQFAITISISVTISSIMALVVSPVMAAFLLRKEQKATRFSLWFDRTFHTISTNYIKGSAWMLEYPKKSVPLFLTVVVAMYALLKITPTSLVPNEDQGYLFILTSLPENASVDRTQSVDEKVRQLVMQIPGVERMVSLTGFSLLDGMNRSSIGSNFLILKPWEERKTKELSADTILKKVYGVTGQISEARVLAFNPPPIHGIDVVGGFEMWIQDASGGDLTRLEELLKKFVAEANQRPELRNVFTTFDMNSMQVYVDLDREKARMLSVSIDDLFHTLQGLLGTVYVNDFIKYGRVYKVLMQAQDEYRKNLHSIGEAYVRSQKGEMIPIKALVNIHMERGPAVISRFNGFIAAKILGSPAPGYSSGDAMRSVKEVANKVFPNEFTTSFGGLSLQEEKTGGTSLKVLFAGIFVVYLILSALYERWAVPIAILLTVPLGTFGALLAVWLSGMNNDIYFQIGLITLVGLATKNAILIVEFALQKSKEGSSLKEAALEATKLRFRAIVMTSLTTIIGILPLVFSKGAGAASRQSVGVGIFGGMTAATFLAILFVPLFYILIARYGKGGSRE
ncbi:MAG: efflux RND transporter permease subunit [Parachlamydiaceae bacterium]